MSFTLELYNLLIKYALDYQGKVVTLAELQNRPWCKCVWGWWRAKAYYKMDGYYERIEDVPKGLENYTIMGKVLVSYRLVNGHITTQVITMDDCKSYYGSVI